MLRLALAVARHPTVWSSALRQALRLAPARWWARPPFLPLPSREYVRFRLLTQYGDEQHAPEPRDVIAYLRWCAAMTPPAR